ncbi:MAG: two-component system nitrate/nitrite response regulator NarL [Verrucomicrobiales bacterium]|jgi:two-component system nitrate/nitrite response regulator NarL
MTRIAIVDDHILLGQVLAHELESRGFDVGVVELGGDVVDHITQLEPDIVLLDLELGADMPSGVDLVLPITETGATVIVLTGVENGLLHAKCLETGAHGILPKNTEFNDLVDQISSGIETGQLAPSIAVRVDLLRSLATHRRKVRVELEPFAHLTGRESTILRELMAGRSPAEISEASYVAISTVRSQVKAILRKLNVSSQLQAVALANEAGWPHVVDALCKDLCD